MDTNNQVPVPSTEPNLDEMTLDKFGMWSAEPWLADTGIDTDHSSEEFVTIAVELSKISRKRSVSYTQNCTIAYNMKCKIFILANLGIILVISHTSKELIHKLINITVSLN